VYVERETEREIAIFFKFAPLDSVVFGVPVFMDVDRKDPPPPRGGSSLGGFQIKNPEEEDSPRITTPKNDPFWGWFIRGGPLRRIRQYGYSRQN